MKIDNKKDKIPLFVLIGRGVNNEDIYVTGSHLVYNKEIKQFIKVENYPDAKISNVETEWFSCLITNDHKIHIGNEIFWDWEDYYVKLFLA
jgi:RecJ-like exonuclease